MEDVTESSCPIVEDGDTVWFTLPPASDESPTHVHAKRQAQ